jgi:hypothetical protein
MRLDQAVDVKYNGISAKQIYCNNNLIWPQITISGLFWDFTTNPSGKILAAFNVQYEGGEVIANWGDGSSETLDSSVNYNHTFS